MRKAAGQVAPSSRDGACGTAELSQQVLQSRYLAPGESDREAVIARVARALAEAEPQAGRAAWARRFARAMQAGFIPGGRILAAAGRPGTATWINCFVLPLAGHPLEARALDDTVTTLRAGGGVGLDFSTLDDPLAALHAFDEACARATGASTRPGALMGVLRIDHPRIGSFIGTTLPHFNLSVAVTDDFMQRVETGEPEATATWRHLAAAALAGGEPGVIFIDTIRRDDSLADRETICALNPCGEQPLPPHGSCCLGSMDLTRFVRHGLTPAACFDHAALARVTRTAVRMLDNVIDLTPWPLPPLATEARRTRRIGLGITGLADALLLLGLRYSRAEGRNAAAAMVRTLRDVATEASVALARERGAFPAFAAGPCLAPPGHASRLPRRLRDAIARHGLRHSHRLSMAPAGSISLAMAGGVSTGVEPVWGWHTVRQLRQPDGSVCAHRDTDPVWRRWIRRHGAGAPLPPFFETLDDISPAAQLAMVATLAPLVDGAIAKTVQLRPSTTVHDVERLLQRAWTQGVKGLALYRPRAGLAPPVRPTPA